MGRGILLPILLLSVLTVAAAILSFLFLISPVDEFTVSGSFIVAMIVLIICIAAARQGTCSFSRGSVLEKCWSRRRLGDIWDSSTPEEEWAATIWRCRRPEFFRKGRVSIEVDVAAHMGQQRMLVLIALTMRLVGMARLKQI